MEPLPVVRVSQSAVTQVLEVLLDNALRHGIGTVTLEAHGLETGVAITVRDEGTRTDATDAVDGAPESQGHGIGLTLASRLAAAEGGRLLCPQTGEASAFHLVLTAGSVEAPAPRGELAGQPA